MVLKEASQAGNAVLYILIATALFGALSYSFMRGGQSGQGNLTKHQARLAALEMIDQANKIERAVQKLLRNGCSETELNFNHSSFPTSMMLSNTGARPDGSCDVYGTAGGVPPLFYPKEAGYYEDQPSGGHFRKLYFPVSVYILNVGTNYSGSQTQDIINKSKDLTIAVNFTNKQVCEEISRITGFSDTLFDGSALYSNNFTTQSRYNNGIGGSVIIRAYDPIFSGKMAGCFYQGNAAISHMAFPRYIFYRVLIAR